MGRIVKAKKPRLRVGKPEATAERIALAAHIGAKLLELRQRDSVAMVDVGNASRLSSAFICQLENGGSLPSAGTLLRLSRYFKVTIDSFFEGYESP